MDKSLFGGLEVIETDEEWLTLEVSDDQRGLERFFGLEGCGLIGIAVIHEAIREGANPDQDALQRAGV